ncbi:ATPase [Spirochaetia bacterium]|nr:ATPase [Spirochaetia bacterium]
MIKRPAYVEELLGYRDKHIIKVVTGVRRCGKSTLLEMYQSRLHRLGVAEAQIIYLNFEDMGNKDLTNAENLHRYILKKLVKGKMNYIFFDEIQMVTEFPRVVDSLFIKKNIDLYITGSNQYFLSAELATLLTGRYVTINMMPLSFKEYTTQFKASAGKEQIYEDYLRYSSFPFTLELGHDLRQVKAYLEGIYNTIVMKDVAARRNIVDLFALDSVSRFIFDNIGNLTSIKKIADTMQSGGRKISVPSVESYLVSLTDSFMIYRAKRYDVKGKRQLLINDKYYCVDIALRSTLLGEKSLEVSHVLENVIFLELVRRYSEVYVGKIGDLEIDFIAMRHGSPEYYQVAATVRDPQVLARELTPLMRVRDSYPKFLLSLDRDPPAWHEGIRSMNALDFLLGSEGGL